MKKSEKLLLGGLLAVAGGWFGLGLIKSTFMQPLEELRNEQLALTTSQDTEFQKVKAAIQKETELGKWRAHSLPPNASSAQTAYQQWVFSLMTNAGFEEIKAEPQAIKQSAGSTFSHCPVKFTAKGTLDELTLFLERFETVDLMHRIDTLKVESPTNEGDPELNLTIVAEGIALKSAPDRTLLFPKTELFAAIPKDAPQLIVTTRAGFPDKAPFLVRIDEEFLNVTEVKGDTWTVQRGVERSFAENHAANVNVELFPVVPKKEGADSPAVAMKAKSPFTKPAPPFNRQPRMESTNVPTAVRGMPWSWTLAVADWNPAFGKPTYEILSGPQGMSINKGSGRMSWRVPDSVEANEVSVSVLVLGPNGEQANFNPKFDVRVRDPNPRPTITTQGPLKFFIGRQSSVKITAEDPAPNATRLRYELQNAQNGMSIDANSGVISWRPPEDLMPSEMNVTVRVSDTDELTQTAERQYQVVLAEDSAQYAYLTGVVQSGDSPPVGWITDRATLKHTTFKVGDQIQIADFDLKIIELGPTWVVVQRDDEFFRLDQDNPLVKMRKVERPQTVSAPSGESAAEKPLGEKPAGEQPPAAPPQNPPSQPGAGA